MNYDEIINKYEQNMFAMSIIYYMIVNRKFGQFYGYFSKLNKPIFYILFLLSPTFFLCKLRLLLSFRILTTQQMI